MSIVALSILCVSVLYDFHSLIVMIKRWTGNHFLPSSVPFLSLIGYSIAIQLTESGFLISSFIDFIILSVFHILVHFVIPFFLFKER